MTSIRNLENRVDQLEDANDISSGDGYDIMITETVVHQDGTEEVFEETHIWEDEHGEWRSETTEYDVERGWP